MDAQPRSRSSRRGQTWGAALLVVATVAPAPAFAQALLPPPSYESSVHVLFDAPGLAGPDDLFNASADSILSLPHGPYARLGVYRFVLVSMAWQRDTNSPLLSSPTFASMAPGLERAKARGLEFHMALLGGMSRNTSTYNAAFLEDRRNAQWYQDGAILKDATATGAGTTWATPSRYARKLRRHMESKTRETARLLVSLRKAYPETFLSASGDGEAELNFGGLDTSLPFEAQSITDYSPFAILEFRDWIQHAGLYADGAVHEGQGFPEGGVAYQGEAGLSAFNVAYGTSFTSWSLRYFDWSLTEPVDADPRAIPTAVYSGSGWNPLPASGADFIAGGFDAPRAWGVPSAAFHALWLRFRVAMLHNYVSDFSDWITTTPDLAGTTFEAERWFTHQIPADYLRGTFPGCPAPDRRLLTSASPFDTAFPRNGRMGLTVFDVVVGNGYQATSEYLLPEIQRRGTRGWGLMEYSPSWPETGLDMDAVGIAARIRSMWAAGARVINYHTWPHLFGSSNAAAFTLFLSEVRYLPADSAVTNYAPPKVMNVEGRHVESGARLTWSSMMPVPGFQWDLWQGFSYFEVWAGPVAGFDASQGRRLGLTRSFAFAATSLQSTDRHFRVRAVSTASITGEFSDTWTGGFHVLTPCRAIDTRESTGPAAGAPALSAFSDRVVGLAGLCGIPATASAVSANVTVVQPGASGTLRVVPGDRPFTNAELVPLKPGRTRANNAILALAFDGSGTVAVRNDSSSGTHFIIDVNGYFQ